MRPYKVNNENDEGMGGMGKYKQELCKNWSEVGYCRYGQRCRFAHGEADLQIKVDDPFAEPAFDQTVSSKYKTQKCR